MAIIELSQNKSSIIDDDDIDHISKFKWSSSKNRNTYYAVRGFKDVDGKWKRRYMHHEIITIPEKNCVIDHINGNGLDNRKNNLRYVTIRDNASNSYIHRNGHLVGVTKQGKSWLSRIKINGKKVHLGSFLSEKEAHDCYINALK